MAETLPFSPAPALKQSARKIACIGLAVAAVGTAISFLMTQGTTIDPYPADAGPGLMRTAVAALILGIVGALITGYAISRSPADPATLALGAATAFAARFAAHADLDAFRLVFFVGGCVSLVAAIAMAVPQKARWAIVSALIVFHYCGIISAITSPPPTPWLTSQLWVRVFRPHLQFSYVNNAYQFYSPEPGPANILWFCIIGADGQNRWVKIPDRKEPLDPLQIEYYRRLSLCERVNANEQLPFGPPQEVMQRRMSMAAVYPLHTEAPPHQQYRMPDENARQFLSSYVRHIANTYGSGRVDEKGAAVPIRAIKVYLTQHRMMSQKQYSEGVDPYAKWTYLPFFLGEFDTEGKLLNPVDPMLYWIVPILREPRQRGPDGKDYEIRNYVELHAGSDPFEK